MAEERITNTVTGAEKGRKDCTNASKPENAAIPKAPMNVHKEGH